MNAVSVSQNVPECPKSGDRLNEVRVGLNENQLAAIELLIAGKSMSATAKAIEIDRRTLYRWRQDEAFSHELQSRRREMWSQAADRLRAMVHPSLDVMEQQLCDRYDRARFRAATAVLRLANLRQVVAPCED